MDELWIIELDVNKLNQWRIVSENWFRRPEYWTMRPEDMMPRPLEEVCEMAAEKRREWKTYQEGTMRLKSNTGEVIAFEIFT